MTVDHAFLAAASPRDDSPDLVGDIVGFGGAPLARAGRGGTSSARLLAAAATDLDDHAARCGPLPWRGPGGALLRDLHDAGLTGRGGAAYPTWRKLAATAEAGRPGLPPHVIANAAEGEPESRKDATLITTAPHLVLDGVQLAAQAVGAVSAWVAVKPGPGADSVRRALAQRRATGWDRCPTQVHEVSAGFLAGEASAVAASVAGTAARPHAHWQPLAEAGVHRRPTLVQNVETLAHLATIARWGAPWFRSAGTADDPGTFLVTITGAVQAPGVLEVPGGTLLGDLLDLAGGPSEPIGALRTGGFSGTWLPVGPPSAAGVGVGPQTPLSTRGLAAWEGTLGPGIVTVVPARACGLAETARIVAHLASRNSGQCGPCVSGLPQLAQATAAMAVVAGRGPAPYGEDPLQSANRALRLAALVAGRGACHHPDGTARLVRSALRTFAADIRAHTEGRCRGSAAPDPRP